jgi:hypothetical protein
MKSLLRFCVFCVLLILPTSSRAAPAVNLTLHDAGILQIKASGFAAGADCWTTEAAARACRVSRSCQKRADADLAACSDDLCKEAARTSKSSCFSKTDPCALAPSSSFTMSTPDRVLGEQALADAGGTLADELLKAGAVWCTDADGTTVTTVPVTAEPRLPLSSSTGAWRSFDDPNQFSFLGWDRPGFQRALAPLLEKDWSCEFSPDSGPANTCTLTRELRQDGGVKLVFDAARSLTRDRTITVFTGKDRDKKTIITLRLSDCKYTPKSGTGTIGALYADSDEQLIELTASPSCLNQLATFDAVNLALGDTAIQAAREESLPGQPTKSYYLRTRKIPPDIPAGMQEFEMRVAHSTLGVLRILVKPPALSVIVDMDHNPLLGVNYDSEDLDHWHSGSTVQGLAVVTPKAADGAKAVINSAAIDIDSSLLQVGVSLSEPDGQRATKCQDLWARNQCIWYVDRVTDKGVVSVPLDPGDPDQFCSPAKFSCAESLNDTDTQVNLDKKCLGLALEAKVDVCRELLDEGAILFDQAQDLQLEAHRNDSRAWRISEASWGGDLWFEEDWLRRGEARHVNPTRIGFSVFSAQKDPLKARVELRDRAGQTWFRTTLVLAKGARLESLPLPLGNALMIECGNKKTKAPQKLPPRFGPSTSSTSSSKDSKTSKDSYYSLRTKAVDVRDRALNGESKAVNDSDLDAGLCVLHYSPLEMATVLRPRAAAAEQEKAEKENEEASATLAAEAERSAQRARESAKAAKASADEAQRQATKTSSPGAPELAPKVISEPRTSEEEDEQARERVKPMLNLFGEQLVEVVITRGSEPPITKSWAINPAKDSYLPLPGIKARAGDYTVVAHLKGPQPLDVTYRPGPQKTQTAPGSATALSTDFEFHAILRPRGLGGWLSDHWRTYITFPIRFTGLRFPAKSSELATSRDATAVQLAGIRAGVLAALEPWNYDTRSSSSLIPFRFMSGFNLYDLAAGRFDPAFLLGGSFSFPVLELDGSPSARNLSSTVALGIFWEVDLERKQPLKEGNHLLVTLGIDVGSLLAE